MNEAAIIIVPTDISKKIREIEESYNRYINEFRIPNDQDNRELFSRKRQHCHTRSGAHYSANRYMLLWQTRIMSII
ncbi:hypothetical protein BANRA_04658 [Escherichia coli]|nr:hypothetical protein BANRA_04658 [Escherichia coli]